MRWSLVPKKPIVGSYKEVLKFAWWPVDDLDEGVTIWLETYSAVYQYRLIETDDPGPGWCDWVILRNVVLGEHNF